VEEQQRTNKNLQTALRNGFLDEYLVQSFKTSASLAGGIWMIPD
jgi:hypothetical protein